MLSDNDKSANPDSSLGLTQHYVNVVGDSVAVDKYIALCIEVIG